MRNGCFFVAALSFLSLAAASCSWGHASFTHRAAENGQVSVREPTDLRTVAESSNFTATSTSDHVRALLDSLAASSPRVRLSSIGQSGEGKPIPLAIIADPPISTPEEAAKSGKLVVLLVANIHAGEVDGKEALFMLMRELVGLDADGSPAGDAAEATPSPLLKNLIVAVVPNFNPDGNDRMAKTNRPGQLGPEEGMGTRENAEGLDLNRDFVKLASPEARALVRFMRTWDPSIVVDAHTTNGSLHRYLISYGGPKNPAGDPAVVDFARTKMFPALTAACKDKYGLDTYYYGNFGENHTTWTTYPPTPRFLTNYVGMRNRLSVLVESYSYAPYKDRVLGTRDFCREVLVFADKERDAVRTLVRDADTRARRMAEEPVPEVTLPLRTTAAALEEEATILGFVEKAEGERTVSTGEPRDYRVRVMDRWESTHSVRMPYAYLLPKQPAEASGVLELLQRHGVRVDELREDIEVDAERFVIDEAARSAQMFQKRTLVTLTASVRAAEALKAAPGWYVVRTGQPLGALAAYLLEPMSEDGLGTWGFYDTLIGEGNQLAVVRVPAFTAMLTTPARALAEDRVMNKRVTFDAVYGERPVNFSGSPVGGLQWLKDGSGYLQVKDGKLRIVDPATGRARAFHDAKAMAKAIAALPTIDDKAARSISERTSFRMNEARTTAVFEHENDLYAAAFDGSMAVRLTNSPESERYATFSPDGAWVAFVRENDLWVVDVQTHTERRLTSDGSSTILNGRHDWVYFEELFNRNEQAFWWSPDSTRLAFLRTDRSMVPIHTLVDEVPEPQTVERQHYPKPGQPNPKVTLWIVTAAGGAPTAADTSGYTQEDMLISGVHWWPDSQRVLFFVQNRVQTWLDYCSVGRGGGDVTRLFRDSTAAWIAAPLSPRFLADGSFITSSERDGFRHLYRYSRDGKLLKQLTRGDWEVSSLDRVDEKAGVVYFHADRDNRIGDDAFSVMLKPGDDPSEPVNLTPQPGTDRADVSPSFDRMIVTGSSRTTPTRVILADASGTLVRTLDSNPVYALEEYVLGEDTQFQITASDGTVLEASMVKPPEFDAGRRYPVWFTTYAGPAFPSVRNTWGGGRTWDQMIAEAGFIVFRMDPRSASGKGARDAWQAYKKLGKSEAADIADAIKWLIAESFVDASRIGMSGHSYGGFMTLFAMTHEPTRGLFAAGIAGAPVTDWRDYDTIYTERYMLTPQDNPEGYDGTSIVKHAKNLTGKLLLLHGTMDDNVHPQNSTRLVRALQEAGTQFELMMYPQARHGIRGRHYHRLMYDFIVRTLGDERDR